MLAVWNQEPREVKLCRTFSSDSSQLLLTYLYYQTEAL